MLTIKQLLDRPDITHTEIPKDVGDYHSLRPNLLFLLQWCRNRVLIEKFFNVLNFSVNGVNNIP